MKDTIRISQNLALPADTVTQAVAILAKRRMGKSYLARKLAEGLHAAGQQLVIIDPKGDWWGIRSSADGKSDGLPILIIGGEHGDVPLDPGAGETIAKLVVEETVSVLLDLSELRKHEIATFMPAFMEPLYRLKAREQYRTPLMVLTDEADAIAPQKPQPNEARMLGAFNDLVRRGGQRGIGVTFITQRSAVLSKDVLTQAQILIALRVIAPQDLAAIKAWVDVHGTIEEQKTLMASLPSLPVGDAWVWSPGWPTDAGIFQRIHTLPISTFDSGATPKPGQKAAAPKRLADIDLEAVKRQMSETLERAKADDPKVLRARIAELEQQLEAEVLPSEPVRIEVPVFGEASFGGLFERINVQLDGVIAASSKAKETIGRELVDYRNGMRQDAKERTTSAQSQPSVVHRDTKPAKPQAKELTTSFQNRPQSSNGDGSALGKVERLILTVLAQQAGKPMTRERLALLVGYHANAKGFANGLGALRGRGSIDGLAITDTGLSELGHYDQLPTGRRLLDWYCEHKLSGPEAKILRAIARSGAGLTREGLAADVEYHPNAKSFANGLGRLRGLGLIEGLQLSRELR